MTESHSPNTSPLSERYGEAAQSLAEVEGYASLKDMIARGSCRAFRDDPVDPALIRLLCAAALASPTKSDLQQRDIIVVQDSALKQRVLGLMSEQNWIADIPCLLVFCGNNRRQRRVHELRGREFVNDHLDAFFNAAVDAGIALSACVTAAEALGLGCCPISAIRNKPQQVSDLLDLPQHVFPVAGLAIGHPVFSQPRVTPRLPLEATVHVDRYSEAAIDETIETYDARRNLTRPYAQQRSEEHFGTSESYGWSEEKARQYALPERQDFGQFVRAKGFDLS